MNWHDELNEVSQRTSGGKEVFQKKPFGRRWYLISGAVTRREFSTTTSGTERERGFVGKFLAAAETHSLPLKFTSLSF